MIKQNHKATPVLPDAVNLMIAELDTDVSKIPSEGTVIPAGQIIEWKRNGEVSECNIWKTAKVYAELSASTALQVYKGHSFATGDTIYITASRTITAVDKTTSADYDIITLNGADSITAGTILYYRENPATENGYYFAFTKDEIVIQENQTTLSIPVYAGSLDKRIYSDMLGSSTTLNLIAPKKFLKMVPSALNQDTLINYTTTEIAALTGMVEGDIVWDATLNVIKIYDGSSWLTFDNNSIPKYTTVEIDALTGMAEGDMVYDTDLEVIKTYSGAATAWIIAGSLIQNTTAQIAALTNMQTGELRYDTDKDYIVMYDGSAWVEFRKKTFKKWVGLISQAGTSAPTAIVLENELSGAIVWTYDDVGSYIGTLAGEFIDQKTGVLITSSAGTNQVACSVSATDEILIETFVADGTLTNTKLSQTMLEIRVYP